MKQAKHVTMPPREIDAVADGSEAEKEMATYGIIESDTGPDPIPSDNSALCREVTVNRRWEKFHAVLDRVLLIDCFALTKSEVSATASSRVSSGLRFRHRWSARPRSRW
jgi:hypothetical protein